MAQEGITLPNIAIFLIWTATSFLCHYCAKRFLTSDIFKTNLSFDESFSLAGLVTFVQIVFCHFAVDVHCLSNTASLQIVRVTHVLATFATNMSLAVMFASSALAIKLMEPITAAVILYCVQGTPFSPMTVISVPIIVVGAMVFSGNPFSDTQLSVGVFAALLSNILLAFRNIAVKKMEVKNQPTLSLKVGGWKLPIMICGIWLLWLQMLISENVGFLREGTSYTAAMCLLSGFFHVTYTYISTGIVLNVLSVVGHAIANIMKRVLVVLLLYVFGRRTATAYNFLGLAICTLGLLLYSWDKHRKLPKRQDISEAGTSSTGGQVRWGLLLAAVCSFSAVFGVFKLSPGIVVSFRSQKSLYFRPSDILSQLQETEHFAADPLFELRRLLTRPNDELLMPNLQGYLADRSDEVNAFLKKRLAEDSEKSNFLSIQLKLPLEVIKETQRIHYNMFGDVLGKFKYGMLFDLANYENKGDLANNMGEIFFLARFNLELIYYGKYGDYQKNYNKSIIKTYKIAKSYSPDELVILLHGGENLLGYIPHDYVRFSIIDIFKGFTIFVFAQSIWLENSPTDHVKLARAVYCCNSNVTIVLRDKISYDTARRYFNGSSRLLLAPDMAFHTGPVKRFVAPVFDILWIKRKNKESPKYYKIPWHPAEIRVHVSDWMDFYTPKFRDIFERSEYATVMGLFYVQRGRVVVTDRLHDHILCTLSDIPHVLVDVKANTLANYHNTWTAGLENTLLTNSSKEAMTFALELLKIYGHDIPPRVPWPDISEDFEFANFSEPEMKYS